MLYVQNLTLNAFMSFNGMEVSTGQWERCSFEPITEATQPLPTQRNHNKINSFFVNLLAFQLFELESWKL